MILLASPKISLRERRAVDRVLRSGLLAQGIEVSKFEQEFEAFVESRKCVAVNSGTSALHLALIANGVKPGDEVIVPSFTFAATANVISLVGATPVFVDIDSETFNISPEAIEAAISPKTVAIQPVHLYGLPADMNKIMDIANRKKLLVLEDAAQAHLATIEGRRVGTFGDSASFSFYPTKNMTSGEGGMIVCSDDAIYRLSRLLRNQGMEKRYENEVIGFNLRMTDIHAAIGRVQLRKIEKWTKIRRENAAFYDENLTGVSTPVIRGNAYHVYHQYTIRIHEQHRGEFAKQLANNGIQTGVYYPTPVHALKSFQKKLDLPNTELACKEVLSLPVHPNLKKHELEKIVHVVNKVAKAGS